MGIRMMVLDQANQGTSDYDPVSERSNRPGLVRCGNPKPYGHRMA